MEAAQKVKFSMYLNTLHQMAENQCRNHHCLSNESFSKKWYNIKQKCAKQLIKLLLSLILWLMKVKERQGARVKTKNDLIQDK